MLRDLNLLDMFYVRKNVCVGLSGYPGVDRRMPWLWAGALRMKGRTVMAAQWTPCSLRYLRNFRSILLFFEFTWRSCSAYKVQTCEFEVMIYIFGRQSNMVSNQPSVANLGCRDPFEAPVPESRLHSADRLLCFSKARMLCSFFLDFLFRWWFARRK